MKKIKKFFDREQNLLIHIIATILVTIFGIIVNLSFDEWLLIYFMIAFVITSELINSSIELVVDLKTNKYHPLAKIAKDVSASAVLTAAFCAMIVGIYIFVPKIMHFLSIKDYL